jgi:hypothetical protein
MKQVRDLLMDIRIELRQHVRDFHKTDLCKRIDDTRDALLHGPAAVAAAAANVTPEGADRVAQAWQAAAEDLKLTAPAIYDLLAKKVAARIAAMPAPAPAAAVAAAEQAKPAEGSAVSAAPGSPAAAVAAVAVEAEFVPHDATTATPSLMMVAVEAHIPNAEVLAAIAASKRRFTEAQREWCVGEAMVRSGFSIDPEEFIARGDNEMARYLLETVEE